MEPLGVQPTKMPQVRDGALTWTSQYSVHEVAVGNSDWYAWLEQASAFAYHDSDGDFTARSERRRRGGRYWMAYRKLDGRLRRAYLGKAGALTPQRLRAVARMLRCYEPGHPGIWWNEPRLPPVTGPLFGREQEIASARDMLLTRNVRLLTLTGPAGAGKTRLAVEVASDLERSAIYADGIVFVDLSQVPADALMLPTIARAMGIDDRQIQVARLDNLLRERDLLLLLDNCEHLVSDAPAIVDLLDACPGLAVLATSRAALRVRRERELVVRPFTVPTVTDEPDLDHLIQNPAVGLFVHAARSADDGFALTPANARAVAELCTRLDGLPLAIELAAAQVKIFPPAMLLTQLDRRLSLLRSNRRDTPARHQTLRAAIGWSYELLDPQERAFLTTLRCFRARGLWKPPKRCTEPTWLCCSAQW